MSEVTKGFWVCYLETLTDKHISKLTASWSGIARGEEHIDSLLTKAHQTALAFDSYEQQESENASGGLKEYLEYLRLVATRDLMNSLEVILGLAAVQPQLNDKNGYIPSPNNCIKYIKTMAGYDLRITGQYI